MVIKIPMIVTPIMKQWDALYVSLYSYDENHHEIELYQEHSNGST